MQTATGTPKPLTEDGGDDQGPTVSAFAPNTRAAPSAPARAAEAAPATTLVANPPAVAPQAQATPTILAPTQPVFVPQAASSSAAAPATTATSPAVDLPAAASVAIQAINNPVLNAPASTSPAAPPLPPAHQVAAALVQISQSATGSAVTLRLDPAELGHVQIDIARGADGTSTVNVSVERPETLRLLMQDQPQLHRTLDNAGLPQDGRSLTLSLATPDTSSNASSGSASDGSANAGGSGFSNGNGAGQQGGAWRQERTRYAGADEPANPTSVWLRAGVDITA